MNASDERTRSLWMTQDDMAAEAQRLAEDLDCDVVIVGAGIAGLSVAYELSQIGKAVEKKSSGSTTRNRAMS